MIPFAGQVLINAETGEIEIGPKIKMSGYDSSGTGRNLLAWTEGTQHILSCGCEARRKADTGPIDSETAFLGKD